MNEQVRSRVPLVSFFTRLPTPILVALASFYLYLLTLAPDVLDSDGGEFQFAAWNFSFVHPTGYPLFLILGGVFQHLFPVGNPAFRLNVFNAIVAACAVSALYLVANEITSSRAAALITAASFALARTFWFNASGAEVYALNAFFLALLIYLAVRWRASHDLRTLTIFCLVYGLALTHHRTILLWIPAFILFFLFASRFALYPSRSRFARYGIGFLLPLLLYLYIPLRAPASPYFQLPVANNLSITLYDNSPVGFINYILGRTFQQELGWDASSFSRLYSSPQKFFDEFGAIGVVLGVTGLLAAAKSKEWGLLALTVTGFIVTVLFNAIYHIADISAYYIPAYLVWAIWIGLGIKYFQYPTFNIGRYQLPITSYRLALFAVLALTVPGFQILNNHAFANRSGETQARALWTRILSSPIPQNAILISNDRDEMMPLWYIQYVENARRDLLGLFPLITPSSQHANVGRLTDSVLDSKRPVFLIKPMPGIEIKFRVEPSTASLFRVLGRAADSSPQFSSNAMVAHNVRILGYDLLQESKQLRVAIYYQPQSKLDRNYTTFVHLLSVHGGKAGQGNDHLVGGDYYPTSIWQIGETLRDEDVIPLEDIPAGTYRLFVGMYYLKMSLNGVSELDPFGDSEIGVIEIY
jgi:transmembrane protein TMEM260 (protein O-mannosyltransferase)